MIATLNHYTLGGPSGDCWEWLRGRDKKGYGAVWYEGRTRRAHRLSFKLANPDVNIEGMSVMHSCDNPCCINPDHLSVGTNLDNVHDKVKKGRQVRGSKHSISKLNEKQVDEIRKLKGIHSQRALGRLYGVNQSTIYKIHRGLSWKRCSQ